MKLYALIISCLLSINVLAADLVKVGVYDFPPYSFIANKPSGMAIQMIAAMNEAQDKYQFVAVSTTPRRRYHDFEHNKFDMMIFESKKWGWQEYPIVSSHPFVTGAEVYITQAKPGRGQSFFSDFKNKAMIGVMGYHYQFANFSSDQEYLKKNFNLVQTNSQKQSLELILHNRGEIAVISKEYLHYHFSHSPEDKAKLLISKIPDQIYQHTILIRKNHKLSIKYINDLLTQLKKAGTLEPLWKKYGLTVNH